jgi:ATP synthase protein I
MVRAASARLAGALILVARSEMSDGGQPDPLARLGQRLEQARSEQKRGPGDGDLPPPSGLGAGFRIGIELLASLIVGLALGWVADRFLGTRPWGVVVGFFVGAAAGMVNVFREAQGLGRGGSRRGG